LAPAVEIEIERAVTAPVEPAWPTAVAHLPTARSLGAAGVRCVYVVEEVRVTTTLEVFLVAGFVSVTVTVVGLTAVTGPEAAPNVPAARAGELPPLGRSPPPGKPRPPPGPPAPPRANPPPAPNPAVQVPDVGWVMVTVVAVTGSPMAVLVDDEAEVGFPNAETQEPTVTLETVAGTVCSNVVVVV